jgi:hypothetical protein
MSTYAMSIVEYSNILVRTLVEIFDEIRFTHYRYGMANLQWGKISYVFVQFSIGTRCIMSETVNL